ncbi:MAG TPA: aminotransferase class V-fold PLP-dependent enzyme [Gemmatimonadaceae bacterium]|nr:aminotransferase class V-fold PLP-dependent enzyme [Gemmatimonadaceae bacterium]
MNDSRHSVLLNAAERGVKYLDGLNDRPVAPSANALARLEQFDRPLGDAPTPPEDVIRMLDEIGSPATIASAGGRFFGFVIGGSLPVALAANWLAGAWDQNSGLVVIAPPVAKMEDVAARWLAELFGLPNGCGTGFVTSATAANFSALCAARRALLARKGWDVEADGLFGAPPINVVVSDEVHASMLKALGMSGLGRARVTRVPTDEQGRLRADKLPALTDNTLLCLQVGNVNTGAIDPLAQACAAARAAGAWVHIDAAFGLWAAASPKLAHLVAGIGDADSWATDAHKWLNVPYDSGIVFCRDRDALRGAMTSSAAYLVEGQQREPYQYTPDFSRRGRGVEVWAALRALGKKGIADLIERTCRHARRFAEALDEAGLEILNDVVLNQVLVSLGDAPRTQEILAAIQADGTCWCGGTVWHGQPAMRISVSSWATTDDDVERSIAAILRAAFTA